MRRGQREGVGVNVLRGETCAAAFQYAPLCPWLILLAQTKGLHLVIVVQPA